MESRRTFFFFFTRGWCVSCLRACFGARLLLQSHYYRNLSEGADRVGGQLRGDKECPFGGVTKSGRVWRRVPESNARSVRTIMTQQSNESSRGVNIARKTSHNYNRPGSSAKALCWHVSKYTRLCTLHKRYVILKPVHNLCHLFYHKCEGNAHLWSTSSEQSGRGFSRSWGISLWRTVNPVN